MQIMRPVNLRLEKPQIIKLRLSALGRGTPVCNGICYASQEISQAHGFSQSSWEDT
jgi:hypothetical protein